MKLIAGIFEIEKPYFNLDTNNVDRALGLQRATGLELSAIRRSDPESQCHGRVLLGEVKVIGPNLEAEGVGSIALNQARFTRTINANYKFPRRPALSADMAILTLDPPASIDDVAQVRRRRCYPWVADTGSRYWEPRRRFVYRSRI